MKTPLFALLTIAFAGPALAQAPAAPASPPDRETASAVFRDGQGKEVGRATLTETATGVLVEGEITGVAPGVHAFHFHAVGKCEGPDFQSAGSHYNPGENEHGYMASRGPHAGDMPNVEAGADGRVKLSVHNPHVTLGNSQGSLFDTDGSTMMLHAKADDYRSQPSGEAGGRIACAVVEKR